MVQHKHLNVNQGNHKSKNPKPEKNYGFEKYTDCQTSSRLTKLISYPSSMTLQCSVKSI